MLGLDVREPHRGWSRRYCCKKPLRAALPATPAEGGGDAVTAHKDAAKPSVRALGQLKCLLDRRARHVADTVCVRAAVCAGPPRCTYTAYFGRETSTTHLRTSRCCSCNISACGFDHLTAPASRKNPAVRHAPQQCDSSHLSWTTGARRDVRNTSIDARCTLGVHPDRSRLDRAARAVVRGPRGRRVILQQ